MSYWEISSIVDSRSTVALLPGAERSLQDKMLGKRLVGCPMAR